MLSIFVYFEDETSLTTSPPAKRRSYKLPKETKALIDADTTNKKLWGEVTAILQDYPVSDNLSGETANFESQVLIVQNWKVYFRFLLCFV